MASPLFKAAAVMGLSLTVVCTSAAENAGGKAVNMGDMRDPGSADARSDGEVKAVNAATKTITLKHGPVKTNTVDMGPMTMSFAVSAAALPQLSNVKVGDKVKFVVEHDAKLGFVVTALAKK